MTESRNQGIVAGIMVGGPCWRLRIVCTFAARVQYASSIHGNTRRDVSVHSHLCHRRACVDGNFNQGIWERRNQEVQESWRGSWQAGTVGGCESFARSRYLCHTHYVHTAKPDGVFQRIMIFVSGELVSTAIPIREFRND